MYNDYYLQQIYERIGNTNTNIEDIIENQQVIIQNQEALISGDKAIETEIGTNNQISYMILFVVACILIYHFIERIFRC